MKFVYVITSSAEDYYLEQAILSMHSLRLNNPKSEIVLITEKSTIETFRDGREKIYNFVSLVRCVDVPEEYSIAQKSRFLKTSMIKYVDDDFLFIDTDTIICNELDDIKSVEPSVSAVLDFHIPISRHPSKDIIQRSAKQIGWIIPQDDFYYNSGIMRVRRTKEALKLFEDWHSIWKDGVKRNGINADQPALALANARNNYMIKELDGIYNCQIINNGLKFLNRAKIIHYFASSIDSMWNCPYKFRDERIYKEIRKIGITKEINNMLLNPKTAFSEQCMIIGENASMVYGSPLVSIARRVSYRFPKINKLLSSILRYFGR